MPADPAPAPDFLRAPPFPWVEPRDHRLHDGPGAPPEDDATLAQAAAAIAQARVGGAFWSDDDPWSAVPDAGPHIGATSAPAPPPFGLSEVEGPFHTAAERCFDDARHKRSEHTGTATTDAALVPWLRAGAPADDAMRARFRAAVAGRGWRDPFTGAPSDLLFTVALLAEWRRLLDANRRVSAAAGIARWKREAVARFLWNGARAPAFADAAPGGITAAWPSRVSSGFPAGAWIEDGFLRSAGLGADLRAPWSLALDFRRPAFDPRGPSDLEDLLATHAFPPDLTARAAVLRAAIARAGLGKYGAAAHLGAAPAPVLPPSRRVVLAVGQVADDLSVALGGAGLDMDGFLARVRAAEPDAWIVWRPHPDVAAGHRAGSLSPAARALADAQDPGSDLAALLDRADAVHVLSSLTGFEALLRGRSVTVHGQPFYAGWGLTRDLGPPVARRTRRLTLDQLVAAALILYPRYLDPVTGLPCGPEVLVGRIADGRARDDTWLTRLRRAQGRVRRTLQTLGERIVA